MSRFMRRLSPFTFVTWLSLGLLISIICQPLLGPVVKGHDTLLHFYRIPIINALWSSGTVYARWLPDLVLGYGSPLLNFYPPLSLYLVTTLYWLVGQNAPLAFNLAFMLCLILAVGGMYLLGRAWYGPRAGLLAATAYGLAPHFLYQTYARGSIANALAMALFPLAVWLLDRVARTPTPARVGVASLAVASILLSHTAASFLFVWPLGLLAVAAAWLRQATHEHQSSTAGRWLRTFKSLSLQRNTWAVVLTLIAGLALSAFTWLPAIVEISRTRYETEVTSEKIDYRAHLAQPLDWPPQAIEGLSNAPLPKSPGLGQLVLGSVGLALAGRELWSRRRRRLPYPANGWLTVLASLVGIGTLFMTTSASGWLWENVPLLLNLQAPWRWLDNSTFFLALAAGHVALVTQKRTRWANWLVAAACVVFFANALPYLYPPRLPDLPIRPTVADANRVEEEYGIYGLTAWGEYSSRKVPSWPETPAVPGAVQTSALGQKLLPTTLPQDAVRVVMSDPWSATLVISAPSENHLVFATHYFPGWEARVDGQPAPLAADEAGRLAIDIPAGDHILELFFHRTFVRWLADIISGLALISVGVAIFFPSSRWRNADSTIRVAQDPPGRFLPVGLALLFLSLAVGKFAWLDNANNPFVVHPDSNGIPGREKPQWGNFGGRVQLVGYEQKTPEHVILYWQALTDIDRALQVEVILADAQHIPVKEIQNSHPGKNATSTWDAGLLTRDEYTLPVPDEPRPAGYRVQVAIRDPFTETRLPLLDSPDADATQTDVTTIKRPLRSPPNIPPGAQEVGTVFGQAITLSHAVVPTTVTKGTVANYTLVWHMLEPVMRDYTVFVHLLDADGRRVAGNDAQPLAGRYPTSFWSPGETIVDDRDWLLDAPAGQYRLQVGLYHLPSGERLPTSGARSSLGDRVILGSVRVVD